MQKTEDLPQGLPPRPCRMGQVWHQVFGTQETAWIEDAKEHTECIDVAMVVVLQLELGQERLALQLPGIYTARYGERARISNLEQAPGYRTSEGLEAVLAEGSLVLVLRHSHGDPVAEVPVKDTHDLVGRRSLVVQRVASCTAGRLAAEGATWMILAVLRSLSVP